MVSLKSAGGKKTGRMKTTVRKNKTKQKKPLIVEKIVHNINSKVI